MELNDAGSLLNSPEQQARFSIGTGVPLLTRQRSRNISDDSNIKRTSLSRKSSMNNPIMQQQRISSGGNNPSDTPSNQPFAMITRQTSNRLISPMLANQKANVSGLFNTPGRGDQSIVSLKTPMENLFSAKRFTPMMQSGKEEDFDFLRQKSKQSVIGAEFEADFANMLGGPPVSSDSAKQDQNGSKKQHIEQNDFLVHQKSYGMQSLSGLYGEGGQTPVNNLNANFDVNSILGGTNGGGITPGGQNDYSLISPNNILSSKRSKMLFQIPTPIQVQRPSL